jgi:Flp pilus assembly protein TadB
MRAFAKEFPDALDLLVSALRAGLSFSRGDADRAEESPEPVRGEFAVTVEEQALGLEFRDTLDEPHDARGLARPAVLRHRRGPASARPAATSPRSSRTRRS